ncbi:hypothetical protein L596_004668 [Steinernema carpocapsae]|uniref:Uncharacterized protein n=1 Tax=Steinernema carpocapsae TaxID=34508 RepID=A0A4U8UWI1_STECR|nr:hypothetical protein L596_004668 [Steinernema carpocapsae]
MTNVSERFFGTRVGNCGLFVVADVKNSEMGVWHACGMVTVGRKAASNVPVINGIAYLDSLIRLVSGNG